MKFGSKTLAVVFAITSAAMFANAQNIPSIIVQPSSQATAPSGTISFTVSASGAGTLAYQWAKNTTNLVNGTFSGRATVSGATTSTFTLTTCTTNDQANYTCIITNSFGSVTSSIASLTVYVAPTITTQPIGYTNIVGSNYTFSVVASGSTPFTYQWQYNSSNIPSATLNVYTINNAGTNNSGSYTVSVSNPAGTANSSTANLLILAPPVITIQPANTTAILSNSVTFSVTATGSLLHYQWYKNGFINNNIIVGATNSSYTITNAPYSANLTTYGVIITNLLKGFQFPVSSQGQTSSVNATLTVVGLPVIVTQPMSQTAGVGSNVTFSVLAMVGSQSRFYQWYDTNNNPIIGQANSSFTLNNVQLTNSGSSYYVTISTSYGSVTSSIAILTVQNFAPSVAIQPTNYYAPVGSNVIFSATVSGTAPLYFQWLQNGTNLTDGGNIIGSVSNTLAFSEVSTYNAGLYSVIVTNLYGSVTSSFAILNVGFIPKIIQQPVCATTTFGGKANISCTVTGTPPIALQWLLNGTTLAGQTNAILSFSNIESGMTELQLLATNYYGSILSSNSSFNISSYPISYPSNLYQGLVLYYPFDGNANDASGNGNNGILYANGSGTPYLTTDRFGVSGNAFYFPYGGNMLTPPLNYDFYYTNGFTISVWASIYAEGSDISPCIAQLLNGYSGYSPIIDVVNVSTLQANVGTSAIAFSQAFQEGTWYSITLTFNWNTGVLFFYVNGIVIGQTNYTQTVSYTNYPNVLNLAGQLPFGSFTGKIDDVRVYNRVLLSNEISQLYALESGATPPTNITVNYVQNSVFQLQFFGTPNYPYVLQATTNLTPPINWQTITTNAADTYGNWSFTDSNTAAYPARFYRATTH